MRIDVRTADGRLLVAEEWGDPAGPPVLLLHGTPGSRLGTAPSGLARHCPGVRFVAYDRPGYGECPAGPHPRAARRRHQRAPRRPRQEACARPELAGARRC
ncbi:alpha/beta fold hydrolase [Streptomyces scopuliridis]|uniref:alpha/beta fold hydrolase n=1 Tax=Streptomyces scopuliridis TaxID=452529 RepID=UPI0034287619